MKKLWSIITLVIAIGLYFTSREPQETEDQKEKRLEGTLKPQGPQVAKKPQKKQTILPQKPSPQKVQDSPKAKLLAPPSSLGPDFIPMNAQGHRYITHINQVGKHLVYHGDLLIGDSKDLEKLKSKKSLTQARPNKWPQGKIPFVIDEDLPNLNQVMEAIDYLNQKTNVNFVPREKENNYVHFTHGEYNCYSYAGMIGGQQEIYLTPGCQLKEILHESMHSLGFFHEQNREDRDQHVEILWDNIDEVNHPQFKKISNQFLGVTGRPFDFSSIMMYSSYTFSHTPGEPTILTRDGEEIITHRNLLSDEDVERVNLAYPK